MGRVLIIAGSDSGGGAGIQADIKTVTMLGGYAATAVTAITVQNTLGVTGIYPVPQEVIAGQIQSVLSDIGADVIKTGMLADIATIETVADVIPATIPIVVDPVMVATSGDTLQSAEAVSALKERLVSRAAVVTPNIPEAEILTGRTIRDVSDMKAAGEDILTLGAKAVVMKGGHLPVQDLTDLLVTPHGIVEIEARKQDTRNTHGTGCTLASAIAAGMAAGESLETAVRNAHAFVQEAIAKAPGYGAGHGPLGHARVGR
ncbi:hydroxymethylpyrimidine/phosphomethylpyrimidine kinase [Kordiimonas sediminis]|uniref:hydroxymethylpyrimidine kinase n=1 Tax=Kordiimonas sediminis TaxID=1735581 RepID=A0A919ARY9_9PROT|nr:bifunctional hydroxymethylpyrimidine kinase/phosphomethylpyrimidine kinase [Kordiimonas sediminis]GHF23358.1 hydroxymethylpyrimidine/phosphomethylpyrimidine kinase [Kordiimonas sediminis]